MANSPLVLELWRMKEMNCAKTTKVHIKVNHLPSINSKLLLQFFSLALSFSLLPSLSLFHTALNLKTPKVGNLFFMR